MESLYDHMATSTLPTTLEGYGPVHSMAEFVFDRSAALVLHTEM